mmetsp:Transcript_43958/g.81736  ORF Transcript_43958/g.81736 Transcript_43958/m.81736 type:complete len:119 (+) Transcript_43958:68-424(+)
MRSATDKLRRVFETGITGARRQSSTPPTRPTSFAMITGTSSLDQKKMAVAGGDRCATISSPLLSMSTCAAPSIRALPTWKAGSKIAVTATIAKKEIVDSENNLQLTDNASNWGPYSLC